MDIYDSIGGSCRYYVEATDEKGAILKVFKMIMSEHYYRAEELADPVLDRVED